MKVCTKCRVEKPLDEFFGNVRQKDGKSLKCKVCDKAKKREWEANNLEKAQLMWRRGHLRKTYGITPEAFDAALNTQNNCCAICKTTEPGARSFHVDHDHTTGELRGLLCNNCNRALGYIKENTDSIASMLEYVKNKGTGFFKNTPTTNNEEKLP